MKKRGRVLISVIADFRCWKWKSSEATAKSDSEHQSYIIVDMNAWGEGIEYPDQYATQNIDCESTPRKIRCSLAINAYGKQVAKYTSCTSSQEDE